MKVDPRAEWANIFREAWRVQREYFYDPKMQGADWNAIYKKYLPLLPYVGHRADLGYLIAQVGGELTVGHSYLAGQGDVPGEDPVSVGLLVRIFQLITASTALLISTPVRTGTRTCEPRLAHRELTSLKAITF